MAKVTFYDVTMNVIRNRELTDPENKYAVSTIAFMFYQFGSYVFNNSLLCRY